MGSVVHLDRRADHFIESKPRALGPVMDIAAHAGSQRRDLEQMHEAFWNNDATTFLHALTRANEKRVAIRVIARQQAEHIESAAVWVRADGAVATEAATAA